MRYFMYGCEMAAISMVLFKWFQPRAVADFLKRHHLFAIGWLILGTTGLFAAIFSNI